MSGQGSPKFVFPIFAAKGIATFTFVAALLLVLQGCMCSVVGQEASPLRPLTVARNPSLNLSPASPAIETAGNGVINSTPLEAASPDRQLRLRISWGGGTPQTWSGSISVTNGAFSNVAPLGLDSDANAAVVQVGEELVVSHWSATNYGGADVTLTGTADTQVRILLSSHEQPDARFEKAIRFDELISGHVGGEIDLLGNRCSIVRAPGDQLNVSFEREHLVFQPGEPFAFSVSPNETGLGRRTANCRIKLVRAQPHGKTGSLSFASRAMVSKTLSFQLDENGSAESQVVSLDMPIEESIYDIEMELDGNRYQASFGSKKNTVERRVQLLVLDGQAKDTDGQEWSPVFSVAAVDAKPDMFHSWSQLTRIAGLPTKSTLGNELRTPVVVEQQDMMQLQPGGWQAIPIVVDRLGKPHIIELEFIADGETSIGISLLQPDATGQLPSYGVDSGVFIPKSLVSISGDGSKIRRHRMTVWPETKAPYLLVANRHASANATLGSVKVFAGPDRLGPGKIDLNHDHKQRKLMAFYEAPLFAENFGAREQVDSNVAQPLDDWQMFYDGADRFIEYLKSNSYRGAFVAVAADGSSIYPSRHLSPTPKHDNGTFFSNGQDPIRKDVLEMLFRMFEREGLILVPTLAMSSPLPDVEELRRRDGSTSEFEMVDLNGARPTTKMKGRLPAYNPLNPGVQRAVRRVVEELAERYKSYHAFDGVAIICRPDTCTLLPGRHWGYDVSTVQQFFQSQADLGGMPDQWSEAQSILLGSHRQQWIQWRAARMTQWYQGLAASVQRALPDGRLYLAPVDLYRNDETASALSPSLHATADFEQVMLHLGFEASLVRSKTESKSAPNENNIVLLNPHRIAPDQPLSSQRVDMAVDHSKQAQRYFGNHAYSGDLFTHRISWAHFAQLQAQSPFGTQSSPLVRLQQMTPGGSFNRQRFVQSIKDRDARILVDGGLMMTMGQEESIAEMMQVFGQLPDEPFTDVPLSNRPDLNSLPLAVRQFQDDGYTYFYVANASPWPTQVSLNLSSRSSATPAIESLSSQDLIAIPQTQPIPAAKIATVSSRQPAESTFEIRIQVPAFGLLGGRMASDCQVVDFEFELPDDVEKDLRRHVYGLQAKLTKSGSLNPLNVLKNSGFEFAGQQSLDGWDSGQQSNNNVRLEANQNESDSGRPMGQASLWMENENQNPVWVRSNVFEATETGRISISVWLKTADRASQPPLRLALEGQSNGASYYRFGSVGSLSPDANANQIESQWKRFAVHFDDLPVQGISNVRVGFDLMGPGQVSIDNVQVFDRWFDENDTKAMTQMLASAGPLLSTPETFDRCRRLLSGYWPSFLDTFIEIEGSANRDRESQTPANGLELSQDSLNRQASAADGHFNRSGVNLERVDERRAPMFRRFRGLGPQRKPDQR